MSDALETIIAAHVAAATSSLHTKIAQMHGALEDMAAAHADLRDRHERMHRPGKVTDVDANQHLYRQEIGIDENGQPIKSPWRPYSQHAGALKLHSPPSVGQQMLLISPDGDIEQGIGIPYGWSDANPSPSTDANSIVSTFGDVKESNDGEAYVRTIKGVAYSFSASGLDVKGGKVTHDGKDIGSDHTHSGVQPGGGNTGTPV